MVGGGYQGGVEDGESFLKESAVVLVVDYGVPACEDEESGGGGDAGDAAGSRFPCLEPFEPGEGEDTEAEWGMREGPDLSDEGGGEGVDGGEEGVCPGMDEWGEEDESEEGGGVAEGVVDEGEGTGTVAYGCEGGWR